MTAPIFANHFDNKMEVYNNINGDDSMRSSSWDANGAYSEMMEVADRTGNFVSEIIEAAINHRFVSEKQAWCVAFFALNNGFVKV